MEFVLMELAAKFPFLMSVFLVMGVFRMVFKPVMAMLQAYVDATPSPSDNEMFEKFKAGQVYKALSFAVDYLLSIKLPQPAPKASASPQPSEIPPPVSEA